MKPHNGDPNNPIATPIITYKTLTLLYTILAIALTDLVLSLTNLGLTSFFLGLTATSATIIHILTHLTIVFFRLRSQSHGHTSMQWGDDLPPTSKMSSIMMDVLLAVLFIAAFTVTVLVKILDYFDDGSGSGTTVLGGPVGIVYGDAAVEGLCAIMLIVLAVIGSMERRWFLELSRIRSGGGST